MQAHFRIYVPKSFHWYKELFKLLTFYPCNFPLKIRESTGAPTPQSGTPLGCEGSFPHTFSHSREYVVQLSASVLAHNLANLCLGRKPKARVATKTVASSVINWLTSATTKLNAIAKIPNMKGFKRSTFLFWWTWRCTGHLGVIWIVSLGNVLMFSIIDNQEVIYPCLFTFNFSNNMLVLFSRVF